MIKLFLSNTSLFVLFIILFILSAFVIGYISGDNKYEMFIAIFYVGLAFLHMYINNRWLKKREIDTLKNKIISTLIIIAIYVGYLFLYI